MAGIGAEAGRRASSPAWAEQKVIREIMLFLHGHGVGTSRAVRIFKTYGADAVPGHLENPYRLARDIRGIGFKSADQIAARLGIEKTAMIRARAGIGFALAEAMDEGHCGLPERRAAPTGGRAAGDPGRDRRRRRWSWSSRRARVVADTVDDRRCVFLAGLYRAERGIAERLRRSRPGRRPGPRSIRQGHRLGRGGGRHPLAASQREAVRLALRSKLLVITGGPGVGKTTLVNAILRILRAKDVEIALAAPTGRAAKRLQRGDRARGQDAAPPARGRPGPGRLQAQRGAPARRATCSWSTRSRWSTCR